jgi:hypothetical protein
MWHVRGCPRTASTHQHQNQTKWKIAMNQKNCSPLIQLWLYRSHKFVTPTILQSSGLLHVLDSIVPSLPSQPADERLAHPCVSTPHACLLHRTLKPTASPDGYHSKPHSKMTSFDKLVQCPPHGTTESMVGISEKKINTKYGFNPLRTRHPRDVAQ